MKIIFHAAATGAIFINQKYHLARLDRVLVFMGFGRQRELMIQKKNKLNPVLSGMFL